jgi:hypothetical protein
MACNDSPAFQRRHTSTLCVAESGVRFLSIKDVAGDDRALDFAGAFADGASESRRTGGEKQFTLNGLRCISELRAS